MRDEYENDYHLNDKEDVLDRLDNSDFLVLVVIGNIIWIAVLRILDVITVLVDMMLIF